MKHSRILVSYSWCLFLFCAVLLSALHCGESAAGSKAEKAGRTHVSQAVQTAGRTAMGINFGGPADWNTELPFVNVFFESRRWISQREGESWGKGPELELDERGWVRRLEPNCFAETPLCTIEDGHFPSGTYTVRYRGKGKVTFMNAWVLEERPGEIRIRVEAKYGAFWLQIRETDPTDYLRDFQVFRPGFEDEAKRTCGMWDPALIARWKGVDTVRFMDLQHTNGSKLEKWSDRPVVGDASFSEKGVPLELLCELANHLNANAWFCVPHRADDEFVRNMAQTIRKHLKPELKVYVEYSNEVWNGQFEQCRYAEEQGAKLLPDEKPWVRAWAWTAYRSREIFGIFREVFPEKEGRLVRVLASQAANDYVSKQLLTFSNCAEVTDALAIAPYVMHCVPKEYADEFISRGVDGALEILEKEKLPNAVEWMKKQKKIADEHGVALICYEAGQHLVGLWGANDREELNAVCLAANASPRMGQIYDAYFRAWEDLGGGLLCHFSSTGRWSKWGSWGLVQYADEDVAKSPKYRAFERALKRWNEPKEE
ncbi:MAG: hypothetical protein IJF17_08690 [Thermoguttaceae bacterium]|nr:hypothetical protein [Thermoguttaceae bacterium]